QPAGRRGRVLPLLSVRGVALVSAPGQRARRPARDLLLPPVGARPRPAAPARHPAQDPLSPLHQPGPHGTAPGRIDARLPVGPHGPHFPEPAMNMPSAGTKPALDSPPSQAGLVVRTMRAEDFARWDDFVANCPEATFF